MLKQSVYLMMTGAAIFAAPVFAGEAAKSSFERQQSAFDRTDAPSSGSSFSRERQKHKTNQHSTAGTSTNAIAAPQPAAAPMGSNVVIDRAGKMVLPPAAVESSDR